MWTEQDNLVIIPAAGLGTRMGMASNCSKEMLPDPNTGKPIIQWALDISKPFNTLVIVREEKEDLIKWLQENSKDYSYRIQVIKQTKEWTDTVLQSKDFWHKNNILLLPDTRFTPNPLEEMFNKLDLYTTVVAFHKVKDPHNWGIVEHDFITEKPLNYNSAIYDFAWGLLGFDKRFGEGLFKGLSEKGKPYQLKNPRYLLLDKFIDLTRTGVLEKYEL